MKKLTAVRIAAAVLATLMCAAEAGDLQLLSHGLWKEYVGADGINWVEDISVWMDIQVPNWSYDKVVGIVWTNDGWESWQVAEAWYEGVLGNGHERWGIDIAPLGRLQTHRSIGPTWWQGERLTYGDNDIYFDYAIFYELPDGTTIWDNNYGSDYRLTIAD